MKHQWYTYYMGCLVTRMSMIMSVLWDIIPYMSSQKCQMMMDPWL